MKKILTIAIVLFSVSFINAQENKVQVEETDKGYDVVYFHDNGEIAQTGSFNFDGKLDGIWRSYDTNGNKVAIGNYDNGKKTGKWFFWSADKLTEVDYKEFKVEKVNQWANKTQLAIRD